MKISSPCFPTLKPSLPQGKGHLLNTHLQQRCTGHAVVPPWAPAAGNVCGGLFILEPRDSHSLGSNMRGVREGCRKTTKESQPVPVWRQTFPLSTATSSHKPGPPGGAPITRCTTSTGQHGLLGPADTSPQNWSHQDGNNRGRKVRNAQETSSPLSPVFLNVPGHSFT